MAFFGHLIIWQLKSIQYLLYLKYRFQFSMWFRVGNGWRDNEKKNKCSSYQMKNQWENNVVVWINWISSNLKQFSPWQLPFYIHLFFFFLISLPSLFFFDFLLKCMKMHLKVLFTFKFTVDIVLIQFLNDMTKVENRLKKKYLNIQNNNVVCLIRIMALLHPSSITLMNLGNFVFYQHKLNKRKRFS